MEYTIEYQQRQNEINNFKGPLDEKLQKVIQLTIFLKDKSNIEVVKWANIGIDLVGNKKKYALQRQLFLDKIAVSFVYNNEPNKAVPMFIDALLFYTKAKDEKRAAVTKQCLATAFDNMGHHNEATEILVSLLSYHKNKNNHKEELSILVGLSCSYARAFRFDEEEMVLKDFFEKYKEYKIDDKFNLGLAYSNYAGLFNAKKDFKNAIKYNSLALDLFTQIINYRLTAGAHLNLALNYIEIVDNYNVIAHLNKTIEIAEKNQYGEFLEESYKQLYIIYKNDEQYQKALTFATKFYEFREKRIEESARLKVIEKIEWLKEIGIDEKVCNNLLSNISNKDALITINKARGKIEVVRVANIISIKHTSAGLYIDLLGSKRIISTNKFSELVKLIDNKIPNNKFIKIDDKHHLVNALFIQNINNEQRKIEINVLGVKQEFQVSHRAFKRLLSLVKNNTYGL